MATITQSQLKSLRYDLQELAHIEYDEVMAELLDHYATLTEQKMAMGMSFDNASKLAWVELGSGKGIQQIQTDYEKGIRQQIRSRHVEILKGYFRWPTLLTTALISLLAYLTIPHIPIKPLFISIIILSLSPLVILGWGYFKSDDAHIPSGKIVWKYMQHKGAIAPNLIQLSLNLPNSFFDDGAQTTWTFLQNYPNFSVAICLIVLLYTTSFIQLYRYKFHYKIA